MNISGFLVRGVKEVKGRDKNEGMKEEYRRVKDG